MSLPTPSFDAIKKMVDYWRKFRGKRVRIWFSRVSEPAPRTIRASLAGYQGLERSLVVVESKKDWEQIKESLPYLESETEDIQAIIPIQSLEGTITNVIDSPFGLMLEEIDLWRIVQDEVLEQKLQIAKKTRSKVKSMFIPMSEISRIDFIQ